MRFPGRIALAALLMAAAVSCTKETKPDPSLTKETAFRYVIIPYALSTANANYNSLADNAEQLKDACLLMKERQASESLTGAEIQNACKLWKACRENWLRSLSLPVFAAEDGALRSAIGSSPADTAAIRVLIDGGIFDIASSADNLKGLSAAEYLLFQTDGEKSENHGVEYSTAELDYLCDVASELQEKTRALYTLWAGSGEGNSSYSYELLNCSAEGSRYLTYQEALLELIDAFTEATEYLGKTMIGVEVSPLSLNSVEDYKSVFNGIKSCYEGKISGQASISSYVKSIDSELDSKVRSLLTECQKTLTNLKEPLSATPAEDMEKARTKIGTELSAAFSEVHEFIAGI